MSIDVVDVAPDVRQVGPLPQMVGGGLEHDVPAVAARRRRSPRPATSTRRQRLDRDAVVTEQLGQTGRRRASQPSGISRSSFVTTWRAAAWRMSSNTGTAPCGRLTHCPYVDDPGQRPHRSLGSGVRRHRARDRPRPRGREPAAARARPRCRGRSRPAACPTARRPRPARCATCSPDVCSTGMKTAITASTVGIVDRRRRGRVSKSSARGLGAQRDRPLDQRGPTPPPRRRPAARARRSCRPPRPAGPSASGWCASSWATSNISSSVSTWITPA